MSVGTISRYPSLSQVTAGTLVTGGASGLTIGEVVSSDPRTSPGLARPVGTTVYNSAGTVAYKKWGTTDTAWELANLADGSRHMIEQYERTGLEYVNGNVGDMWRDSDQYFRNAPSPWNDSFSGTGTENIDLTSDAPGVYFLGSGSSANGIRRNNVGPLVSNSKTSKWYIAVRMKFPDGVDSQSRNGFGLRSMTGSFLGVVCGYKGAGSNFIVNYDGDFETLGNGTEGSMGVAVDTAWHIFEMRSDGSKLYWRIDSGTWSAGVTPSSPATSQVCLYRVAANGTTATSRRTFLDWHVAVGVY